MSENKIRVENWDFGFVATPDGSIKITYMIYRGTARYTRPSDYILGKAKEGAKKLLSPIPIRSAQGVLIP